MTFDEFEKFLVDLNKNEDYIDFFSYNDKDRFNNTEYSIYLNNDKLLIKIPEEIFSFNLNKHLNFFIKDKTKIKAASENDISLYIPIEYNIRTYNIKRDYFIDLLLKIINHCLLSYSLNSSFNNLKI